MIFSIYTANFRSLSAIIIDRYTQGLSRSSFIAEKWTPILSVNDTRYGQLRIRFG
jgi:hypothetical protein